MLSLALAAAEAELDHSHSRVAVAGDRTWAVIAAANEGVEDEAEADVEGRRYVVMETGHTARVGREMLAPFHMVMVCGQDYMERVAHEVMADQKRAGYSTRPHMSAA